MLKNLFLVLIAFLFIALDSKALEERWLNTLSGGDIATNHTLLVEDPSMSLFISQTYMNSFELTSQRAAVKLWFDDVRKQVFFSDWSLNVQFLLNGLKTDGTIEQNSLLELDINYSLDGGYEDIKLMNLDNYVQAYLKIIDVTIDGINDIPADVHLDLIVESNRNYFIQPSHSCILSEDWDDDDDLLVMNSALRDSDSDPEYLDQNELKVAWFAFEGAECYDFEWLFVDVGTRNLNDESEYGNTDTYDWKNASRIRLKANYYSIPLAYPRGIFLYRVRPVAYSESNGTMITGEWSVSSFTEVGLISVLAELNSSEVYCFKWDGLEPDKNWIYQSTFAEEGRKADQLLFADGMLRSRQSIAYSIEDSTALISTNVYDFYGRETVKVLPVPKVSEGFRFYPDQLKTDVAEFFDYSYFDLETVYDDNLPLVSLVNQGAAYFYSNDNDELLGPGGGYLPNANGYPYMRTIIAHDGTGRIREQGGLGPEFKAFDDHSTKYFYGNPSGQEELDRLFGNEVGIASHYKKTVTIDANGQAYITYTDQHGRTIATGMTGDQPDNLMIIDGLDEDLDNVIDSEPIIVNMGQFNEPDADNTILSLTHSFIVSEPGDYHFYYNLEELQGPPAQCYCTDEIDDCPYCKYDLEIFIYDLQQELVYSNEIIDFSTIPEIDQAFTLSLLPGTYTINKRLMLNQNSYETIMDDYIEAVTSDAMCLPVPEATPVDCENCDQDCTEGVIGIDANSDTYYIFPVTGDLVYFNSTETVVECWKVFSVVEGTWYTDETSIINYFMSNLAIPDAEGVEFFLSNVFIQLNEAIDACIEECESGYIAQLPDQCEAMRQLLLADISPGGQYFDNIPNATGPFGYMDPVHMNDWLVEHVTVIPNYPEYNATDCPGCTEDITETEWLNIRDDWDNIVNSIDFEKWWITYYHPEFPVYEAYCTVKNDILVKISGMSFTQCLLEDDDMVEAGLSFYSYLDFILEGQYSGIPRILWNPSNYDTNTSDPNSIEAYDLDHSSYMHYDGTQLEALSGEIDGVAPMEFTNCLEAIEYECKYIDVFLNDDQINHIKPLRNLQCFLPVQEETTADGDVNDNGIDYYSIWYCIYLIENFNISSLQPYISDDFGAYSFLFNLQTSIQENSEFTSYDFFRSYYMYLRELSWYVQLRKLDLLESTGVQPNLTIDGFTLRFPRNPLFETIFTDYESTLGTNLSNPNYVVSSSILLNDLLQDWMDSPSMDFNCTNAVAAAVQEIIANSIEYGCGYSEMELAGISAIVRELSSNLCSAVDLGPEEDAVNYLEYVFTGTMDVNALYATYEDLYVESGYTPESGLATQIENYLDGSIVSIRGLLETIGIGDFDSYFYNPYASTTTNEQLALQSQIDCNCSVIEQYLCESSWTWESAEADFTSFKSDVLENYAYSGWDDTELNLASFLEMKEMCHDVISAQFDIETIYEPTDVAVFGVLPVLLQCGNVNIDTEYNPEECAEELLEFETIGIMEQWSSEVQQAAEAYMINLKNQCFSSLSSREVFTMRYDLQDYQYTLYYYDLAGNLVKTVPPAGVHPLPTPVPSPGQTYGEMLTAAIEDEIEDVFDVALRRINSAAEFIRPDHTMVTNYYYDTFEDQTKVRTPDGGEINFAYDFLGRIVASQNEKQLGDGNVSYISYDGLGRPIEAGMFEGSLPEISNLEDLSSLIAWLSSPLVKTEVTRTWYDSPMNNTAVADQFILGQLNLRNRISSTAFLEVYYVTETVESQYNTASHFSYDVFGNVDLLVQENRALQDLEQSFKKVYYDYDLLSGVVHEVKYQPGEWDQFYHKYVYDRNNRLHDVFSSTDHEIWNREAKYFYNVLGQLVRNEIGDLHVQGLDYAYNLYGWLKGQNSNTLRANRDIGKDAYASSNGTQYLNDSFCKDAFGFSLEYFNDDYSPIDENLLNGGSDYFLGVVPTSGELFENGPSLYNGNISKWITAHQQINNSEVPEFKIHLNSYQYDQLHRIKASHVGEYEYDDIYISSNLFFGPDYDGQYGTEYSFDPNGNILRLLRNSQDVSNPMDDLAYSYHPYNNQLRHVGDLAPSNAYNDYEFSQTYDPNEQGTYSYLYDEIGQLVSDKESHIAHIGWYATNKIRNIVRDGEPGCGPDLEFKYDPSGNRVCKIVKPRDGQGELLDETQWSITFYIRDANGNVLAIYESSYRSVLGSEDLWKHYLHLDDHELYGSQRLGHCKSQQGVSRTFTSPNFVSQQLTTDGFSVTQSIFNGKVYTGDIALSEIDIDPNIYSSTRGSRAYEIVDHLGNVHAVISDRRMIISDEATDEFVAYENVVLQLTDYYPFGMVMPGRSYSSQSGYRYGFNGKENDTEYGSGGLTQDYGFRMYNPAIAKFLSVDPLAPEYPWYTPYQFAGNMPILAVDLDGMEPKFPATSAYQVAEAPLIGSDDGVTHTWIANADKTWTWVCPEVQVADYRYDEGEIRGDKNGWTSKVWHQGGVVVGANVSEAGWYTFDDYERIIRTLAPKIDYLECGNPNGFNGDLLYGAETTESAFDEISTFLASREFCAEGSGDNYFDKALSDARTGYETTKAYKLTGSGHCEPMYCEDMFLGGAGLLRRILTKGLAAGAAKGTSILAEASDAAFKAADDVGSIFIKNKHLSCATGNYSKFATTEISKAQGWVQQALRSPNARFLPNDQIPNTFQVVTDLGTTIGTKGQTSIRVIVGFDGKVINAFPIK